MEIAVVAAMGQRIAGMVERLRRGRGMVVWYFCQIMVRIQMGSGSATFPSTRADPLR